jgi:hypothetical protein
LISPINNTICAFADGLITRPLLFPPCLSNLAWGFFFIQRIKSLTGFLNRLKGKMNEVGVKLSLCPNPGNDDLMVSAPRGEGSGARLMPNLNTSHPCVYPACIGLFKVTIQNFKYRPQGLLGKY